MPLTQTQINQLYEFLDGNQADDEPRGLQHILTELTILRDRILHLGGTRRARQADGNYVSSDGFHESLADADVTNALRAIRLALKTAASELSDLADPDTPPPTRPRTEQP